MMQQLLNQ